MEPTALDAVADTLRVRARPGEVLIVGVTGSVAVGKTTLCAMLADRLAPLSVEILSTDGFLWPNAVLAARGSLPRKGYPETYDAEALFAALTGLRRGPVTIPVYSHLLYDIDPSLARRLDLPDILLVEGLGLSGFPDGRHAADALDLLIYLDAAESDLEAWYVERFVGLWRAAEFDPSSFYSRFRSLDEAGVRDLAWTVWTGVNLPNLRDHIVLARERADLLLSKASDHALVIGG